MEQTTYGYSKVVGLDFESAIQKVTEVMKANGFGILTSIDVKAKMKEKLGKDMEDYVILGACNPSYAYKALQSEIEIGLLLPCNIIVYKKDGKVHISAIRPTKAMNMIENSQLQPFAEKVEQELRSIIDNV